MMSMILKPKSHSFDSSVAILDCYTEEQTSLFNTK